LGLLQILVEQHSSKGKDRIKNRILAPLNARFTLDVMESGGVKNKSRQNS